MIPAASPTTASTPPTIQPFLRSTPLPDPPVIEALVVAAAAASGDLPAPEEEAEADAMVLSAPALMVVSAEGIDTPSGVDTWTEEVVSADVGVNIFKDVIEAVSLLG